MAISTKTIWEANSRACKMIEGFNIWRCIQGALWHGREGGEGGLVAIHGLVLLHYDKLFELKAMVFKGRMHVHHPEVLLH